MTMRNGQPTTKRERPPEQLDAYTLVKRNRLLSERLAFAEEVLASVASKRSRLRPYIAAPDWHCGREAVEEAESYFKAPSGL